jgi:tRNA A37 methylthiotransferase MiaB
MQIKVFGCKTNLYFAQKWMSETELSKKDGVFVASCVVTDQAKHRWTKFVLRTLRSLPEGKSVYLTGC